MTEAQTILAATLTIEEVVVYLGTGMTIAQFRGAVERGEMPQPIMRGHPHRWSRVQIERALEGRLASGPSSIPSDDIRGRVGARLVALRS